MANMTSANNREELLLDAFVRGFRATDECVVMFPGNFKNNFPQTQRT